MLPLDIKTHDDASYFEPFNLEEKIYAYKYAVGGKILSYLGWATSLSGTDGKVHYFKRQDLKDWLALHQGHKKGTYHASIAEICTKQILKNREIIALKQTCQAIALKHATRKAPILAKKFINKFIIHAKKCKTERLKKEKYLKELTRVKEAFKKIKFCYAKVKTTALVKKFISCLKNRIKINNDLRLECIKNNTYLITIAGQQIVAQPTRMQTSRYFCHFLDFKEKDRRLIKVPLELFFGVMTYIQPSSIVLGGLNCTHNPYYQIENIEIDQEIFNIIKIFLEGKTVQNSQQALANPASTEKFEEEKDIAQLITPYHFEGLYKFHCLFDISGIMAIAYEIDFYSEKNLHWNGQVVSADKFWPALAQKIGDKYLERLCEQKYGPRNLALAALSKHVQACKKVSTQDYRAANASHMSCNVHKDGTLNVSLHFAFDPHFYPSFASTYYQKYLSLFVNWTPEQWQQTSISTLTLDLSKIKLSLGNARDNNNATYISYFYHLIQAINQHLIIPSQQVELVIHNGLHFFLDNLKDDDNKNLILILAELLKKYSRLTFSTSGSKCTKEFYYSLSNELGQSSSKKNLFSLLSLEKTTLDVCYSYISTTEIFSATLKSANQSSQKMIIQYESNQLDLRPFASIEAPFELILDPIGPIKEVWQVTHLNKLKVNKLTVKNTVLNSTFVKEVKDLKNLTQLDMIDCKLPSDCQQELNDIIKHRQKIFTRNQFRKGNCIE